MSIEKIVNFTNEAEAIQACTQLNEGVPHVRLGTAIVVDLNRYTTSAITEVMCSFGVHLSNEVTAYDCKALVRY